MRKRLIGVFLVFLLSLGTFFNATIALGGGTVYAATNSVWTELADIDAAAEASAEGKAVAITMTKGDQTFALPTVGNGSKGQPLVETATINTDGELVIEGESTICGWKVTKADSNGDITYTLQNSENKYLYITADNNGVRIGNKPNTGGDWQITSNYLTAIDSSKATRYMGTQSGTDWRCYTSINNTISGQTLQFWAYDRDEEVQDLTVSDISVALAADSGKFMVKGVITCIDGKNLYLQDSTGAICINGANAVSGYSVGETAIATGTLGNYNGTPQLGSATYEKVTDEADKIDLVATATTIDALTEADVCKYVKIENLTVDSVSGTTVNLKDANENTIQIYKAVLGTKTLRAGDIITFTGAVGIYKKNDATTLQLRNTVAEEIEITHAAPLGEVFSFGLASSIADGDEVIIYNASNGAGVSSTLTNGKAAAVNLTVQEGIIQTDDTSVVWTVRDNFDGTFSFIQGESILGGKVEGSKNNIVLTDPEYSNFILTGYDSSDFNYFLKFQNWSGNYGPLYLEYYSGFTAYGSNSPDKDKFGFNFYKKNSDPETPQAPDPVEIGDRITSLDELTDGQLVAIYSPYEKTAISSVANGDWYLQAKAATITTQGKLSPFTTDYIWKVKVNADGTYSFYSYDNESNSISAWLSINNDKEYAELTVNTNYSGSVNTWQLNATKEYEHAFTIKSSSLVSPSNSRPAYIKTNGKENFAGGFVESASGKLYAMQFYKVDPADAVEGFDDGEWDGVLTKGKQYVIYNDQTGKGLTQLALGIYKAANYAMDAIPSALTDTTPIKAVPGNGAYVFTVDSMGRYYTFMNNGKYLATNNDEELFFEEPLSNGTAPDNAKWYLSPSNGAYLIYNKVCRYKGKPVCIEYFSSVFSGWTYSSSNPLDIYLFKFYEVAEGTQIYEDTVQVPSTIFDCKDTRCIEQDFPVTITLDDLCPAITTAAITYTAGTKSGSINTDNPEECEVSSDKKNYTFTIPAENIDSYETPDSFRIDIEVSNDYGITYTGSKTIDILDEPFIEDVKPLPGSQTGEDKKPQISARVGNVGENPQITLTLNDLTITEYEFKNGILSYTPHSDLSEGRTKAVINVIRQDNASANKTWSFTVGDAAYQLYFGQLHSHTTYSDGSGSLDDALDYVASLPESANVQFVAFTDHSNYFDSQSAANPADALNDASLMTAASKERWDEYRQKTAHFNSTHTDQIALSGFEMTWSGGPGHINTFQSDGIVSRNNAILNNKTDDAGMKLYYETLKKGDSISQFNHPGATFGTFADFSYWDEETDNHMYLVEVGNGEGQIGSGGYFPSYEQYTAALDKGWHLAPTNNQDNHKGRWGNANDARDVILTNDFSEQGLYEAIRARRVYSTEDKNLKLGYTVNGEPMGTIFKETPSKFEVEVTAFDPDVEDPITKVELITNGGKVAHTWDSPEDLSNGFFTAEITPSNTYYYVRVTQADKDLAVTAPIWTGKQITMGIDSVTSDKEISIVNEETILTTTLSNSTGNEAKVKALTYSIGGTLISTDTTERTIEAGGTLSVNYKYTPTEAKRVTITVSAVLENDGSDFTYNKDITLSVRENAGPLQVVSISTVQAQTAAGYEYAIEGIVTSNASGYDQDTAFFDCVYVQDETAGICCFPVSGNYKIGDKVHIEGYTEFYQGEMELQVQDIKVIGEGTISPTEVTAAQINNTSVLGSLVTLKGTVESVEKENGLIMTIMVKDAAGETARVFIDGYITKAKDVANCEVGATISATGLASYDNTFNDPYGPFPRIRVRNREDVVCTAKGGGTGAQPAVKPSSDPNQMGTDGTAVGPGASAAAAEKAITSCKSDEGPKGTKFSKLTLNSTSQKKNSIKLKWAKVKGVKKVIIYGNKSGSSNKMKKITVLNGGKKSYNVKKIAGAKLKKGTYYKFIIVSLDKDNNVISTSKVIHVATKGDKKKNNPSKVSVKKKTAKLKRGKSFNIEGKAKGKDVKKHRAVKYESTNTKIATVSKSGKITGKKKGTCYVYAYAQNGKYKKVKVVVK